MRDLEFHPFCELFNQLSGDALKELADDIKENGLHIPIVLHEGKIIDGRNRYQACRQAGIDLVEGKDTVDMIEGFGQHDPAAFVRSFNLVRRHLTPFELAECADRLAGLKSGRPKKGVQKDPIFTKAQAAKKVGSTTKAIKQYRTIKKRAIPAVATAARKKQIPLSTAAKMAKLPKPEQEKLAAQGPAAMKAAGAPASRPPPRGGLAAEAREANREAEASGNGSIEETHEVLEAMDACWAEHKQRWSEYPVAAPIAVYKALRAAAEAALLRPEGA